MIFHVGLVCVYLLSLANTFTAFEDSKYENCGFNLNATCETRMVLKADGKQLAVSDQWKSASTVYIPQNTHVIEIQCQDDWLHGGIIASGDNGLKTDETWSCSPNGYTWKPAFTMGSNTGGLYAISPDAEWIWTPMNTWKPHSGATCKVELDSSHCSHTTDSPVSGSGFNLYATCFEKMKVFIDDKEATAQGGDPNQWRETKRIRIPSDAKSIAIQCEDGFGAAGGIVASGSNLITDGSWDCKKDGETSWSSAQVIEPTDQRNPSGISTQAKWIWIDKEPCDFSGSPRSNIVTCKMNLDGSENQSPGSTVQDVCGYDPNVDTERLLAEQNFVYLLGIMDNIKYTKVYEVITWKQSFGNPEINQELFKYLENKNKTSPGYYILFLAPANEPCDMSLLSVPQQNLFPIDINAFFKIESIENHLNTLAKNLETNTPHWISNTYPEMMPHLCMALQPTYLLVAIDRVQTFKALFNFAVDAGRYLDNFYPYNECSTKSLTIAAFENIAHVGGEASFERQTIEMYEWQALFSVVLKIKYGNAKKTIIFVKTKTGTANEDDFISYNGPVVFDKREYLTNFFIDIRIDGEDEKEEYFYLAIVNTNSDADIKILLKQSPDGSEKPAPGHTVRRVRDTTDTIKRNLPTTTPLNKWIGGFPESNPAFSYPSPNLTHFKNGTVLPLLGNMDNIDKLDLQLDVKWPEFSWETELRKPESRAFQMFAPDISRLGYTVEGRVFSIICPQQGAYSPTLGSLNVEVTVTGQRGWVNQPKKSKAADLTVVGKIWFGPGAHENLLVRSIWWLFRHMDLPFPYSKKNAIVVKTHSRNYTDQLFFSLWDGESTEFEIPEFAKHPEAWAVSNLRVQIGQINKTDHVVVNTFNQLILNIFNEAKGNMLKENNTLYWNVWFTEPQNVNRTEWRNHAEKWRDSIDTGHGSPDGNGTYPKYFNGTIFNPFKGESPETWIENELEKILGWLKKNIHMVSL